MRGGGPHSGGARRGGRGGGNYYKKELVLYESKSIRELRQWYPEEKIGIATQGGLGLSYHGHLLKVDEIPITYREDVTVSEYRAMEELPCELAIIAKYISQDDEDY